MTTSISTSQFDLNNPQHLAMRKVAAYIYQRHTAALNNGVAITAARYEGMADALGHVALRVFNDLDLFYACFELREAMDTQKQLHEMGIR